MTRPSSRICLIGLTFTIAIASVVVVLITSTKYAITRPKVSDLPDSVGYFRRVPEPMVLSLSYWEQTANALKNLFDLQCWASTMNITKVVMPTIEAYDKSVFHFSHNGSSLKFEDLFDLNYWNGMSLKLGYSVLISQQYFLQHASRDIVYVQLLNLGNNYKCLPLGSLTSQKWYKFLLNQRFNVQKTVCIDFKQAPSPGSVSGQDI